ncbi:hypothetical protein ACIGFL_09390 [Pseudomonas sp. NPDC077649]|uniref:hypothetical protein n=1 Tax=Pseudomonas sp. NPDC077649 TaxID=3364423 RepID=UPI0037CBD492
MKRFNPGDMALVVGGNLMLGQQVEVLFWANPGDLWHSTETRDYVLGPWLLEGAWIVTDGETKGVKGDKHLMPLRGTFTPEREKSSEVPA